MKTSTEGHAMGTEPPRAATRIDRSTGLREEAAFFGPTGEHLFGVLHAPAEPPRAGVVVCPTLGPESLINYRQETQLARALAKRGFAVQRFLYRGSGSSSGRPEEVSFDRMLEDSLTAQAWMRQRTEVPGTAYLGTRLGGLVAAAAAGGSVPVALWDPVITGDRFFNDMFLLRSTIDMTSSSNGSKERPSAELERQGWVDILGYKMSRALRDSLTGRRLEEELIEPGPVLLVQIGGRNGLRPDYSDLVSRWNGAGSDVTPRIISDGDDWRRLNKRAVVAGLTPLGKALVEMTEEWLERVFPRRQP